MRRVLTWTLRIVGALIALALLAVGAVVVILQTDWGHGLVKARAVAALNGSLRGKIDIGQVDGNMFAHLVARDVVVSDPAGHEVLRIARLEARYALLPLLSSTVRLHEVELDGVTADIRRGADGRLNVAAILPPPSEKPAPSPWKIDVRHAVVRDAAVTIDLGDGAARIDGIQVDGHVGLADGRLHVSLASARARWVDRDLAVTLRGEIDVAGDELRVADLVAEAGASRIAVPRASIKTDGGGGDGAVAVVLAAGDVVRLVPDTPWRADATLLVGFVHHERWDVHAAGTLAGTPVTIDARIAPSPLAVEATVRALGVDPAAVWATAPHGRLRVEASADTNGVDPRALRGSAKVVVAGHLLGNRIDDVTADVTCDRGKVGARVRARAENARVVVDGGADVLARPIVLARTRVTAHVDGVSRFLGRSLPIGGDVDADLVASGPLDDLAVSGTVRGADLAWTDVRVGALSATLAARGLPAALAGHVDVAARDVRKGKTALGDVHAVVDGNGRRMDASVAAGRADLPFGGVARASIDRAPDGTLTLAVPELTVRTRKLTWQGHAARVVVTPGGDVSVTDASLRSPAGAIVASGRLSATGGGLTVELTNIDVDQVRRAVAPDAPLLRGTIDGTISAERAGTRFRAIRAKLKAAAFAWRPGGDTLEVSVDAKLAARELTATVAIDGGKAGTIGVQVGARTPVDPLDIAAWRRFDQRDLRRLHVDLKDLSIARLVEAAPIDNPPDGTIGGTIDVGAGLASLDGKLALAGFTTRFVDQPLGGEVDLALRDGRLTVTGKIARPGGGAVGVHATAAVPARMGDWGRIDADNLEDARIVLDHLPLAACPPLAERLPGLAGTVSGDIHVAGMGSVVAKITLDQARAGELPSTVDAQIDVTVGADRAHATLATRVGDARFVNADVALAAGLRALRRGDLAAFRTAAATGRVEVKELPLALVRETLKLTAALDGKLDARVAIGGSIAAPAVRFDAELVSAHVGPVAFDKVAASARLDGVQLHGTVTASQQNGGTLEATVDLDSRIARAGRARIKAQRFDLAFLMLVAPASGLGVKKGIVDADLEIDGSLGRPSARGSAKVRGAEVRVAEVIEQLHDASIDATFAEGGAVTLAVRSAVGARGKLSVDAKAQVEGLTLGVAEGTFQAESMRIDAAGTRGVVSASGKLAGKRAGDLYALDVTLESGEVSLPKDTTAAKLHPTGLPDDVVLVGRNVDAGAAPVTTAPFLRVHVVTPGAIGLRGDTLRADVTADLDITVGGDAVIRGQLSIDSGYFDLFGRHWDFAASEIVFDGRTPINPRLSIHLGYAFQATTVLIGVTGTLKRPTLELTSDSDQYDKAQLLGFVLGGSPDDTRPSPDTDLAQNAVGTASGLVFGQLQPLVSKIVPIDVISVKRESNPAADEPSTLLTLGKWFTSDIYVAYRHRFATTTETTENTHEGLLEYFFWRRWRLDIVFGDAGDGSADVLWINRW